MSNLRGTDGYRNGLRDVARLQDVLEALAHARRSREISLDEAAAEMRCTVADLIERESGVQESTAAWLWRYARVLGGDLRVEFVPSTGVSGG